MQDDNNPADASDYHRTGLIPNRRQILAGVGAAAAAIPARLAATTRPATERSHVSTYHPAGLYKPQEDAAGLMLAELEPPPGLTSLDIGVTSNPRTWPILNGNVKIRGLDMRIGTGAPGELFYRQLKNGTFDISEMSTSFLMIASMTGDTRFVPIPVFTSRYFFHTLTLVRKDAKIFEPADLKGRRVGVPEYMMTGALWTRGVFKDEFGVQPEDIEWWAERLPSASQGNILGKTIPSGVHVQQIPAGKTVGSMMLSGELDAAVMYIWAKRATPEVRSTVNLYDEPTITTLFRDPVGENMRYFDKTGIHHINHCALVKREVLEKHPGMADFAMRIFGAANDVADHSRLEAVEYYRDTGLLDALSAQNLERRLTPYGVEPNRKTLEALARYSHDQGFTPRLVDIDRFFGAVTTG